MKNRIPNIGEIEHIVKNWFIFEEETKNTYLFQKILQMYTFSDITITNSQGREFLEYIDEKTHKFLEVLNKNTWNQSINIKSPTISHSGDYWKELLPVMLSYQIPQSNYYQDLNLKGQIKKYLSFGHQFLLTNENPPGNWWAWDIGIPLNLLRILFLAEDLFDKKDYEIVMKFILVRGFYPKSLGFPPNRMGTGMNHLWCSFNFLLTGIWFNKRDFIQEAKNAILDDFAVNTNWTGDGLHQDGTFHQHVKSNMTGINMGYGISFLEISALMIYILSNSPFSLNAISLQNLNKMIKFINWNSWNSCFNYYLKGRALSRSISKNTTGGVQDPFDFLRPIFFIKGNKTHSNSELTSDLTSDLTSEIIEAINSGIFGRTRQNRNQVLIPTIENYYFALKTIEQMPEVNIKKISQKIPFGCKHYPEGRLFISRGLNHFYAIQVSDKFHKYWFQMNGENMQGYRINEGSIFYITPQQIPSETTQYAQPWNELMGTTHQGHKHYKREKKAHSPFIAMSSFEDMGVTGVLFQENGITARKSYFSFGPFLFLMGSHISRKYWGLTHFKKKKGNEIQTTILTQPLNQSDTTQVYSSDKFYFYDMIALKPLITSKINAQSKIFEEIKEINVNPRDFNLLYAPETEVINKKYRIVKLNHGFNPKNAQYTILLAFETRYAQFEQDLDQNFYQPFINEVGHCIINKNTSAAGIFFKPGSMELGRLSHAGSMLWYFDSDQNDFIVQISINITKYIQKRKNFPIRTRFSITRKLQYPDILHDERIISVDYDEISGQTNIQCQIRTLNGEIFHFQEIGE